MRTSFSIIAVVTTLSFGFSACQGLLQTEPRQSVSSDIAISDITGLRALLISCYDGLQGAGYYGQRMFLGPDILADNVRLTNTNSNRYFQDRVNTPGTGMGNWGRYGTINSVNFVLTGIDGANTNQTEKSQIRGEASFLRGLLYFDLIRSHAYEPGRAVNNWTEGVIIRDTPTSDASQADFRARASVQEVYQFIERDLQQAIQLLPAGGNRFRANRSAAQALLARVYLYWGRWAEAVRLATDALNTTSATLTNATTYPSAWRTAPNPEALFELSYVQATESLGSNESMQSLTTLVTGAWSDVVPTNELLSLYEPGDIRRALYLPGIKAGESVFFIQKFTGARGPWTDNMPLIRVAELLLIRAEAYAESNQLEAGLADLNRLRASRQVSLVTASSGPELIDLILRERRLELAFEGHRWFDLKRKGRDITKAGLSATVPYADFRLLAAIPIAEVQLNTKLRQNPGY